jgi:hypothetical protein
MQGISRVADLPWKLTPDFSKTREHRYSIEVFAELPKALTDFLGECCRMRGAVSFDAGRAFLQAAKSLLDHCTDGEREQVERCVRSLTETLLEKTPSAEVVRVCAAAHGKMAGKVRDLVLNSLRISKYVPTTFTFRGLLGDTGSAIMLADLRELENILPQQSDIPTELREKALGEVRAMLRNLNS